MRFKHPPPAIDTYLSDKFDDEEVSEYVKTYKNTIVSNLLICVQLNAMFWKEELSNNILKRLETDKVLIENYKNCVNKVKTKPISLEIIVLNIKKREDIGEYMYDLNVCLSNYDQYREKTNGKFWNFSVETIISILLNHPEAKKYFDYDELNKVVSGKRSTYIQDYLEKAEDTDLLYNYILPLCETRLSNYVRSSLGIITKHNAKNILNGQYLKPEMKKAANNYRTIKKLEDNERFRKLQFAIYVDDNEWLRVKDGRNLKTSKMCFKLCSKNTFTEEYDYSTKETLSLRGDIEAYTLELLSDTAFQQILFDIGLEMYNRHSKLKNRGFATKYLPDGEYSTTPKSKLKKKKSFTLPNRCLLNWPKKKLTNKTKNELYAMRLQNNLKKNKPLIGIDTGRNLSELNLVSPPLSKQLIENSYISHIGDFKSDLKSLSLNGVLF